MRDWIQIDLLVVSLAAVLTPAMVVLGVDGGLIQVVVGALFVLFAPGYALVSLLLPSTHLVRRGGDNRIGATEVPFAERTLLAVGLSIALVPMIGVVLHYSPLGLGPDPYLIVVGVGTLALTMGAVIRRGQLEPSRRFSVGSEGILDPVWRALGGAETDREVYLNVLFVLGLTLAVAGIGTAIVMSDTGEQFTEFYVTAEDPDTEAAATEDYPAEMTLGEESEFVLGITNQEHQTRQYTVVVELQRLEDGQIVEVSELQRFERTLAHNETVEEPVAVEPNLAGEGLRLSFQLYLDTPPANPSAGAAYRHVYVWVDVSSA